MANIDQKPSKKKFDLGIACVQVYQNYGSAFTNFALYKLIKDCGLNVLLIEQPLSSEITPIAERNFINYPFPANECARIYRDKEDMKSLNGTCRAFLVGSDQLFNFEIYKRVDGFTKLDWVDDGVDKYCYATSLGVNRLLGAQEEQADFIRCLKRFKAVSVREYGAKRLLKDEYGIDTECVLDPVFLCNSEHYIKMLAPYEKEAAKNTAFCYILDPDAKKQKTIEIALDLLGMDAFIISDMWRDEENIRSLWTLDTRTHIKNEIWLANLYHSDFVITDSYHALCFALIFKKQFVVIPNQKRGNDRFESILDLIGLRTKLLSESACEEEIKNVLSERIDYSVISSIIIRERARSERWIRENLLNKNAF